MVEKAPNDVLEGGNALNHLISMLQKLKSLKIKTLVASFRRIHDKPHLFAASAPHSREAEPVLPCGVAVGARDGRERD